MIREDDVRQKMSEAISREISVPDFARWIMSNSWNMHQNSSKNAVDLVSEIHLLLSERDDFSLDDAAFLRELLTLENAIDVKVLNVDELQSPQLMYVFRPLSPSPRLPFASVSL